MRKGHARDDSRSLALRLGTLGDVGEVLGEVVDADGVVVGFHARRQGGAGGGGIGVVALDVVVAVEVTRKATVRPGVWRLVPRAGRIVRHRRHSVVGRCGRGVQRIGGHSQLHREPVIGLHALLTVLIVAGHVPGAPTGTVADEQQHVPRRGGLGEGGGKAEGEQAEGGEQVAGDSRAHHGLSGKEQGAGADFIPESWPEARRRPRPDCRRSSAMPTRS
ncbi:MAG: hypothetical protein AW08_03789 [Candidatus Accumulibacter adjunctus]|uniref:Uncharacterized protein n=1 Tax=Candidatus Accumulibacter adjunctus TaxID=1454001 RepID=A0A011PCX9_9PROT|nr:MAG: hypothetical protein AW08_03789 [Candidatus Accumulibacter adjunctus]